METGVKVKANEVTDPYRRFQNSNYLPMKLTICVRTRICDHKISCSISTFAHWAVACFHYHPEIN